MYDGYSFVSYKHDADDTTSIADNALSTLIEDKAGVLWIGSWLGLERFDRATSTFRHFTPNPRAPGSDPCNNVCAICEDKNGALWVGTWGGLYRFDRVTEKFSSLRHDTTDPGSIAHNSVQAIYEDKEGSLWFGTAAGLDKFDFVTGQFIHCLSIRQEWRALAINSVAEYSITSILEDDAGMIWLGTNRGLVEYNPREWTFVTYPYTPKGPEVSPYVRNGVSSICWDPTSASPWIITPDGLFTFNKKSGTFVRRAEEIVTSLCVERSGTLLLGTNTGLQKLNVANPPFNKYPMGDIACGPTVGKDGVLWVYGFKKGYHKFDTRARRFLQYSFGGAYLCYVYQMKDGGDLAFYTRDGTFYIRDSVGNLAIYLDPSSSILGSSLKKDSKSFSFACHTHRGYYIGSHGGSLYLFDPRTNGVSEVFNLGQSIYWIHRDRLEFLWIATILGRLVRYDPAQDTLTEFVSDTRNPSSWNGKPVNWVCEDSKGRMWFATSSGIERFDSSSSSFIHFTEQNGLLSNNVRGIGEDDHGDLWVSTTKGISRFDPETGCFKNYDVSYGLDPAADVYYGGVVKAETGEIYVGGANGLTGFHPDSIRDNPFIPTIVITSFRKFDKPCPLPKEIHLPYDENFISFEFAALSYISPERNQYAYQLEGVDRDWVYSGTRRYASYPNLDPGEYVFRVKGSNNEGIWNESGTSIAIVISPPWWKSRWAYALYAVALMSAVYGAWRMQMRRVRVRHEYEMSRFEAQKFREVDEMKSRFFANISHEFRTPLTLILGPVRQVIDTLEDEKVKQELRVVHRNARRLLDLVNELLDLSKLESGNMKLQAVPQNIVPLVKGLAQSFCSYAERKRIAFIVTSTEEEVLVYIDRDKIEKILTNVLSNAFKFTPESGLVEVSVSTDEKDVNIRVSDTGIGIPAGKIPRIFDRFYQVDSSHTREHEGTGIGLSLTRELVELHKGKIEVESKEGRGTTIVIRIPLGRDHLKPEEICAPGEEEEKAPSIPEAAIYDGAPVSNRPRCYPQTGSGLPVVLVVEDNADVREYIRGNLNDACRILEAADGEEGWNRSIEETPDIIVSDVMMPKMDGFELCKKLKTDERTSHIPVILLTAKATSQDKIEGFETGADDYIMKPFEPAELKARVRNLIDQRERLHEHFRKHGLVEIEQEKITPIDQRFLRRLFAIITEHMADASFGVENLSFLMAVSRSSLFKKVDALIGEPPNAVIRRTRLNKAATLLEGRMGNVSEIALEVGFSNPSYFTKCFRRQFGMNPSEYHPGTAQYAASPTN